MAFYVLNGVAFGCLLFVLASGFTLALGLVRVVNIAHGAFYMLGAFVAYSVVTATGNFVFAIVASALLVMVLAAVLQAGFLKRFQMDPLRQVLFTYGVTLIIAEAARHIWGGYPMLLAAPPHLRGVLLAGPLSLPRYRAFVIGVAAVLMLVLWLMMERTRIGATVRACIDDREIASTMGIDVERVLTLIFAFAGLLAGIAGAIGAPFIGAYQGVQFDILTLTLVVVVIGGLGSIFGAFLGSLLIGIISSVGVGVAPELSYFLLFGPMIIILTVRPRGLLGREDL